MRSWFGTNGDLRFASSALLLASAQAAYAQCDSHEILASDAAGGDQFGAAIALEGSTALVGAPLADRGGTLDAGAAYVLRYQGGTWVEIEKLTPPVSEADEKFGSSVDLFGIYAAVGSPGRDGLSTANSGSVLVFEINSGKAPVELAPSVTESNGNFGWDVAIDGDRIIAGARLEDDGGFNEGAAYVFQINGAGAWLEEDRLTALDGEDQDRFGSSVDIDGDFAIVGAYGDDDNGSASGAAYIFEYTGFGWLLAQKLVPGSVNTEDNFGWVCKISGNTACISAPGRSTSSGKGTVYAYERSGGVWAETAQILPPLGAGQEFGRNLDLDGDTLVVGDALADPGAPDSGEAYVFKRQAGMWTYTARLAAQDPMNGDQFGGGVAVTEAGSRAMIGAPLDDQGGADAGSVYAYAPIAESAFRFFCFCKSGPCGNAAPWAGCENFTGVGAKMTVCGTPSISSDDLVLSVDSVVPNQFGIVFMGDQESAPMTLGNGRRCVDGILHRYPAQATGSTGSFQEGPGLIGFANSTFPSNGHITVGSTWHFQGWYRDPLGPCGNTSNISNAIAVTFEQ